MECRRKLVQMLGVDPTKADDDSKITRFWMEGGKSMKGFRTDKDFWKYSQNGDRKDDGSFFKLYFEFAVRHRLSLSTNDCQTR